MTTFTELRCANLVRQREWQKGQPVSLSYRGNEMAGETGEACNVLKKLERERMGIVGSRATVDQLAQELADVIICVDLIASEFDINLAAAVRDKFNATSERYGLATRMPVEKKP
jgi:NTP pyrophosphatase (non-canonical NTP hydrolase)